MFGWMGQLARVNLTTCRITRENIPTEILHTYIGGRGLGARLLYDEVGPEVQPLDPANKLIFAVGPLIGTEAPASGRFSVTSKSPLTGTIFDANLGGKWGVSFKKCGFDALIIEGKADKPVYLSIKNAQLEIKEAENMWGLDVPATTAGLLGIPGISDMLNLPDLPDREESRASVACIGPAGENQVKFASIVIDGDQAPGRGGLGAVMGSKNLKAIVVEGTNPIQVADQEKFATALYQANKWLKANPITSQGLPEFGSPVLVNLFNELGIFPCRNFQAGQVPDAAAISGETLAETFTVGKQGCNGCQIQCTRITRVGDEEGAGPEYEAIGALGAACGIGDLETIIQANFLCNRLGMDPVSAGTTLACAMELNEKGLLAGKDQGSDTAADLHFDASDKILPALHDIAYRRGFGDKLAEGSRRLAEDYGVSRYAMQVKGLELPAYEPRGMQGMGLAFATSNKGACHLSAFMIGPEVLGVPKMVDRFTSGGKAGLTINKQNADTAMDALVLCRSASLALNEDYFAAMLSAVTGINFQPQELLLAGERIWNLERMYNLREGFSAADDTLPERLLEEPLTVGPSAGHTVDLGPMLAEYYRFRGWDAKGVPAEAKLARLGLEFTIDQVAAQREQKQGAQEEGEVNPHA